MHKYANIIIYSYIFEYNQICLFHLFSSFLHLNRISSLNAVPRESHRTSSRSSLITDPAAPRRSRTVRLPLPIASLTQKPQPPASCGGVTGLGVWRAEVRRDAARQRRAGQVRPGRAPRRPAVSSLPEEWLAQGERRRGPGNAKAAGLFAGSEVSQGAVSSGRGRSGRLLGYARETVLLSGQVRAWEAVGVRCVKSVLQLRNVKRVCRITRAHGTGTDKMTVTKAAGPPRAGALASGVRGPSVVPCKMRK